MVITIANSIAGAELCRTQYPVGMSMSVSCQGLRSPQDVQEDRTYGIQYGCIGTDPADRFSSDGVRIFKEIFSSMQNIWNTARENR